MPESSSSHQLSAGPSSPTISSIDTRPDAKFPSTGLRPSAAAARDSAISSPRRSANTSPLPLASSSAAAAHKTKGDYNAVEPRDSTSSDIDENARNGTWGWENNRRYSEADDLDDDDGADEVDRLDDNMPSDLRPPYHRPTNGHSEQPLLHNNKSEPAYSSEGGRPSSARRRRSSFRATSPDTLDKNATRKRYAFAAFFLVLSLVSFAVQTETAVYIQHELHWNKAYAMMYFTHGSWSLLWFLQLGVQRLMKWSMPWETFWRRHVELLYTTAQMVEFHTTAIPEPTVGKRPFWRSPWWYVFRTTAFVTCALTIAGASWYIAVDLTTASDLTAIYNCSAFFAYVFSVPILKEKLRLNKSIAVVIAIVGVIVVAYGGSVSAKHGGHSGGGAGGPSSGDDEPSHRTAGNMIIGFGSIIYGLYEVLYKKFACPPDDTSPGRSMIFANFFGTCIGFFTLFVLWIPLPILHVTGIEVFEWPRGQAAWLLAISTVSNAIFSGSFLVLISLTSPVLSSVAALLTIFIVALVDELLPPPMRHPLSTAAIIGGCLIIGAFLLLSWATYKEMDEERQKKLEEVIDEDSDDE